MTVAIRPYEPGDWDDIRRIHDAARLDELRGAGLLDGNDAALAFYDALGFVLEKTTTGKLAGNERFTATGHTLVWRPPSSRA